MTVYTLPARPGRQTPDADAEPRPVPWQQMLWVTWRQHRGLLISVGVMFVVLVAAMVGLGTRIHQDYGALMACRPVALGTCQGMSNFFSGKTWKLAQFVRIAVQTLPVLLAMFAGPPVLARELENSTFRYAWTQGIGRVRWTVLKFAILGSVVVVPALVVGQLFRWFIGPYQSTQLMTVYGWWDDATPTNWSVFNITGISYAAWMLTALCLGVFLGMLVRRILPAMAITVAVWVALALFTAFFLLSCAPITRSPRTGPCRSSRPPGWSFCAWPWPPARSGWSAAAPPRPERWLELVRSRRRLGRRGSGSRLAPAWRGRSRRRR